MKQFKTFMSAMIPVCVLLLGGGQATGQTSTEIIDATGDGAGNGLSLPTAIAVDAAGNVYMAGGASDNAFKITPRGCTEDADCDDADPCTDDACGN